MPDQQLQVADRFIDAVVSEDRMIEAWRKYESLQKKLAGPDDFVSFRDRNGGTHLAPTKRWRIKLERFFGVSVEIVDMKTISLEEGEMLFEVKARAFRDSASHEATAACSTLEKRHSGARKYHDALTHAETRAKNRAIFEFVGGGEVSAEELTGDIPQANTSTSNPSTTTNKASQKQVNLIHMLAQSSNKGIGWTDEQYKEWLKKSFDVESSKDLTKTQAAKAIDLLNEYIESQSALGATNEKPPF